MSMCRTARVKAASLSGVVRRSARCFCSKAWDSWPPRTCPLPSIHRVACSRNGDNATIVCEGTQSKLEACRALRATFPVLDSACGGGSTCVGATHASPRAGQHFAQGRRLFQQGDYGRVLWEFAEAEMQTPLQWQVLITAAEKRRSEAFVVTRPRRALLYGRGGASGGISKYRGRV
jgi:hypothetical protein